MKLNLIARKVLGRGPLLRLAHAAYRHGLVIASPMHNLHNQRNQDVLKGEYIRASSLELVAAEITERQVPGAVAELGVYRGEFASLINAAFPDRKLYLFDTFFGFDPDQQSEDSRRHGLGESVDDFSNTSVSKVLARMKFKQKCVVIPGVFPESAAGCDETQFAFVSIDCDLYRPIYEGLNYFYPRLAHNGYIFVHDYNNARYGGAKDAVRQFAAERHINYFPLTDASGSAVIAKA